MKELAPVPEELIEQDGFANRKLIRPTLNRNEFNHNNHGYAPAPVAERRPERPERGDRGDRGDRNGGRKQPPSESTNAENFYYQKQMQGKTPMVIVLLDDEEVHGTIEWYDKNCLKLCRNNGMPNVVVYKPAIKYMYKEGETVKK
jgi:sRNA-binding regulator protein Hfq